jgi:hypothetical protein
MSELSRSHTGDIADIRFAAAMREAGRLACRRMSGYGTATNSSDLSELTRIHVSNTLQEIARDAQCSLLRFGLSPALPSEQKEQAMSDDDINKITSFPRSRGIDEYRFERLTKSRAVVIPHNGRACRVVFPLGGADWRGPANTIANLRHALGPFETKAPRRPRRLKRSRRLDPDRGRPFISRSYSEPAAPAPDRYFAPLRLLKAQMVANRQLVTQSSAPPRIALKTPWLGGRQRWATI